MVEELGSEALLLAVTSLAKQAEVAKVLEYYLHLMRLLREQLARLALAAEAPLPRLLPPRSLAPASPLPLDSELLKILCRRQPSS